MHYKLTQYAYQGLGLFVIFKINTSNELHPKIQQMNRDKGIVLSSTQQHTINDDYKCEYFIHLFKLKPISCILDLHYLCAIFTWHFSDTYFLLRINWFKQLILITDSSMINGILIQNEKNCSVIGSILLHRSYMLKLNLYNM